LNLSEKKKIVEALHERLSKSKIIIVTDYKGLDVDAITKLRRSLKDADAEYSVVKNSLLHLASEETDAALLKEYFKGPSAIALSYHDPVAPAKVISEFAAKNEKFEVKIGAMDGRTLQLKDIKALSSLPSREVLLAQVLSAMNAVPSSFVRTLNEIPRQLLYVLQAIKDQKEAE
jgi:large subunit ribosomal protein L10